MADATAPATLQELPPQLLINLRGDVRDPAFTSAVAAVLGVAPPDAPNTVTASGELSLLWLGPDEWLVTAPEGTANDLAERLETALRGTHHSVCDLSAGRVVFELAGPEARAVLAQGVSLDLHPRAFEPGRCVQTVLARVPVLLHQIDPTPRFRLYVRASFAPYIAEWLKVAIAGIAPAG